MALDWLPTVGYDGPVDGDDDPEDDLDVQDATDFYADASEDA